MANPFTTGPFNCCSCPQPPDYDAEVDDPLPKYIGKCGCPTVSYTCVSESKTATLCGLSEYAGFVSSPPKKYKTVSLSGSESFDTSVFVSSCDPPVVDVSVSATGGGSYTYNCADSSISGSLTRSHSSVYSCVSSGGGATYSVGPYDLPSSSWPSAIRLGASATCLSTETLGKKSGAGTPSSSTSKTLTSATGSYTKTLDPSSEDTEDDALTRATATADTLCSSLYQLRTTSFSFTQRTVTYTATATNLVPGITYEGCVRIRRREAYNGTLPPGADTAWYDVEPDTIASFTPTANEEEVATDVALPNAQGYEYEVVGAYVWPVSAGCDCPTSYVAP